MTGELCAIARFCTRRRVLVLGTWLVVAIGLVGVAQGVGDNTNDNLSPLGTNSQLATDTLSKSFPDQADRTSPVVLYLSNGKLTDSKYSNAVNQVAADVAPAPYVASVVTPLTSQGVATLSKSQATGCLSGTCSHTSASSAPSSSSAASHPTGASSSQSCNRLCAPSHIRQPPPSCGPAAARQPKEY